MAQKALLGCLALLSLALLAGFQTATAQTNYGTGNNTEIGRFITALNSSGYTRFANLLQQTNASALLAAQNSTLTCFAPTNDAFTPVLESFNITQNSSDVLDVLLHHFAHGYYNFTSLAAIVGSTQLVSLDSSNDTLTLNAVNRFLYVNNATITDVDMYVDGHIAAQGINFVLPTSNNSFNLAPPILTPLTNVTSNGAVPAVNATVLGLAEEQRLGLVLSNQTTETYNTFLQLAAQTNFTQTIQQQSSNASITIFAPTDTAFASFTTANPGFTSNGVNVFDLLANHVATGYYPEFLLATNASNNLTTLASGNLTITVINPAVYVGPARVSQPNLIADNQIALHGVNNVLGLANVATANTTLPPPTGVGLLGQQEVTRLQAALTNAGIYSYLLTYLGSTGLTTAIANATNNGQITVFGPTNQAFSNAGLSTASKAASNVSTPTLEYHVAMGYYTYSMLLNMSGMNLTTTEGQNLTVNLGPDNIIIINNASLVQPNLLADGFVAAHGINQVLLLPANGSASAPPGSPAAPAPPPTTAPAPAPTSGASRQSVGFAAISLVFAGILSVVVLA